MNPLDGNVLAGPTADLFVFESTTAHGQCRACADIAALGQSAVYGEPMGYVARCRKCETVLLVIVEHEGHLSLNMRGLRWVRATA